MLQRDNTPGAARPPRATEYWEQLYDLFPAATVLDDLAGAPDDADAARRIVVRFAAIRAAASLAGAVTPDERTLRIERNIGMNHLRSLPMLDREVRALRHMLELLTTEPSAELMRALLSCGAAAETHGHAHGAFAIYFLVYRLSARPRWYAESACAAYGIERLARAGGATWSPRIWRRRARLMERKAAVA